MAVILLKLTSKNKPLPVLALFVGIDPSEMVYYSEGWRDVKGTNVPVHPIQMCASDSGSLELSQVLDQGSQRIMLEK